jgi:hypothetical protein
MKNHGGVPHVSRETSGTTRLRGVVSRHRASRPHVLRNSACKQLRSVAGAVSACAPPTAGIIPKNATVGATGSTCCTDCAGTNVPYKSSPSCCFSSLAQKEFCIYRTMYHYLQNINTLPFATFISPSSLIVGKIQRTESNSPLNFLHIGAF